MGLARKAVTLLYSMTISSQDKPVSESKIHFFKNPANPSETDPVVDSPRLEPSTCVEAETFALRVLDDSMEPEFRQHCIIVIDPTGHAKDGSYVLANKAVENKAVENIDVENINVENKVGQATEPTASVENAEDALEPVLFRQLRCVADGQWQLCALNPRYASEPTPADFSQIIGVIVQRAGIRRRYHKHYD